MFINKYMSLLFMLFGMLLQIIFGKSDVLIVDILGHILFVVGLLLLPKMCKSQKANGCSTESSKKEHDGSSSS